MLQSAPVKDHIKLLFPLGGNWLTEIMNEFSPFKI